MHKQGQRRRDHPIQRRNRVELAVSEIISLRIVVKNTKEDLEHAGNIQQNEARFISLASELSLDYDCINFIQSNPTE